MITIAFGLFGMICLFAIVVQLTQNRNIDHILYFVVAVALILFCGLREVGVDQDSVAYEVYYNMDDYGRSLVAEPSFVFLANMGHLLSPNNGLVVMFFLYAVLGVTIKFVAIRKLTDLHWLALLTYFSTYFLLHEFTQIRAAVASGLLLLSIRFILERRLGMFLTCIGIASLFHYSALVAFPLYWLSNPSLTRNAKILIALAIPAGVIMNILQFNFIYIIPIELIRSKVEVYMQAESLREIKLNPFNAVYIAKYAMLYLLLVFEKKFTEHSKYFPIFLKFYALSLFSYLALAFNSTFAIRISELFGIVEIVMVPLLLYISRNKIWGLIAVLMFAAANLALGIYQTELISFDA